MGGRARIALLVAVVVGSQEAAPTRAEADAGGSGWGIFRRVWPPRPGGDLSAVFANPSVLSAMASPEIFTVGERGLLKDVAGVVLYGQPLKGGAAGGLAGGGVYYTAGSEEMTWFDPITKQEQKRSLVTQQDVVGLLAYGRPVGTQVGVGASVKVGRSTLAEAQSATAVAGDVGMRWRAPVAGLTLSGAVQNVGTSGAFLKTRETLPLAGSLGAAYTRGIAADWAGTVGVEGAYLVPESRMVGQAGLEVDWKSYGIFGGYRLGVNDAALMVGAAARVAAFEVSYAFLPGRFLNDVHRVGLGYRFGHSK